MEQESHPAEEASAIRRNIETVARLEEEFIRNRSVPDRIADLIGGFVGSVRFLMLQAAVFGLWIVYNLRVIPGTRPFDPYPFMLLAMVVSLEAIFLSTFVLMKQNRMSRRADQRAHLDLQINLLAEREMTQVLRALQRISLRLGVQLAEQEVEELSRETSLEKLADEIEKNLPEQ